MKKVGLLTFHRPINFGAVLQAVALSKGIELCGGQCEIIDYINPAFVKAYPLVHKTNCNTLKGMLWELMMIPYRVKQKKEFQNFLTKNTNLSRSYTKCEMENVEKDYDIIVVGSDQVWNLKCSGSDVTYFLDFVKEKPKYSYAASFGDSNIKEENREMIKGFLDTFADISVREKSGLDILKDVTGHDFVQTLDPTLLLNRKQWCEIVKDTQRIIKNDYILIYFMVQSAQTMKEIFAMADRIKEKYGYQIVVIGGSLRKNKNGIVYYNAFSPEEFVSLFRDAAYVLTSSFHGTAFSVNFQKNFYSYVKPDLPVQGRIESLLTKIGLGDRVFSISSKVEKIEDIDYEQPEVLLENERKNSYVYIEKVLNS